MRNNSDKYKEDLMIPNTHYENIGEIDYDKIFVEGNQCTYCVFAVSNIFSFVVSCFAIVSWLLAMVIVTTGGDDQSFVVKAVCYSMLLCTIIIMMLNIFFFKARRSTFVLAIYLMISISVLAMYFVLVVFSLIYKI
jgi:hypothetical protein